jgi:L,D-transpeptidase catalytic domain
MGDALKRERHGDKWLISLGNKECFGVIVFPLPNRHWTGEILQPNAPGRDPIVTRIIWLRGLEMANARAFNRCIYIHGTPQEKMIGRPASYGCIRMRSNDVAALFSRVTLGTIVQIVPDHLPSAKQALTELAAPLVVRRLTMG